MSVVDDFRAVSGQRFPRGHCLGVDLAADEPITVLVVDADGILHHVTPANPEQQYESARRWLEGGGLERWRASLPRPIAEPRKAKKKADDEPVAHTPWEA